MKKAAPHENPDTEKKHPVKPMDELIESIAELNRVVVLNDKPTGVITEANLRVQRAIAEFKEEE